MHDWQTYILESLREGYVYFLGLGMALWGGTLAYLMRIRQEGARFSFLEFLLEMAISGFVGLLTGLGCRYLHMPDEAVIATAGIAGHMGIKALALVVSFADARSKNIVRQEKKKP